MNNSTPTNELTPPQPDILIQFDDVSLIRNQRPLVSHITWQVAAGQRWIIVGPNGAGKTTLMRLAAAEEFPSTGTIWLLGERIGRTDMRDLRAAIGMCSSAVASRIPTSEKVIDLVVSAGYAILGRWREEYDSEDLDRAAGMLTQVGADHLSDRTWGTLSEGERKRVLIARSLMANPELLLLDEPSAGMDLGGREDLVAYLGELATDSDAPTLVMVTHHVEEIPTGFTHALLLDQGGIVTTGPIEQVLTSDNLSAAFHQPIQVDHVGGRFFVCLPPPRRIGGIICRRRGWPESVGNRTNPPNHDNYHAHDKPSPGLGMLVKT